MIGPRCLSVEKPLCKTFKNKVFQFISQMAETARRYGLSGSDYSYEKAPERGWQEGKKDFSNRRTYKKWHTFKKDDKYGIIC